MSAVVDVDLSCDECNEGIDDGDSIYCDDCYNAAEGSREDLANWLSVLRYDLLPLAATPGLEKIAERIQDKIEDLR